MRGRLGGWSIVLSDKAWDDGRIRDDRSAALDRVGFMVLGSGELQHLFRRCSEPHWQIYACHLAFSAG